VQDEFDALGPVVDAQVRLPNLRDRGANLAGPDVGRPEVFRSISFIEIGFGRRIKVVYEKVSHDNLLFWLQALVSDLGPRGARTRHPSEIRRCWTRWIGVGRAGFPAHDAIPPQIQT
jgi:hypothetical protein